jgi:hypothetical protein
MTKTVPLKALSSTLLVLALCGGAGTALGAEVGTKADRELALALKKFRTGVEKLSAAGDQRTRAASLNKLDSALYHLRGARTIALRDRDDRYDTLQALVDCQLVQALNAQAAIHYERGSNSLAMKRLKEAAAIAPDDPRTCNLTVAVLHKQNADPYASTQGTTAINRIRDRRAVSGPPLRERGIALRR